MRKIIGTVIVLVVVGVCGTAAFAYSGFYDVAATDPHWPITYRLIETARVRSIKAHAAGIVAPADLGDQARVVAGTSHFAEHCSTCHSAPGVEANDMAEDMYPSPPLLTDVAHRYSPGELFWILKHGIKMSGMPSWGDHGDEDLWNTVAFMEKLPTMTEEDYGKLVMASMAAGGHHMHGHHDMSGMSMEAEPPASAPAQAAGEQAR